MLSLESAIEHCYEVAETEERKARLYQRPDKEIKGSGKRYLSCIECANEHRQLAKWLRELKDYKDARVGCEYCKHNYREQHERPCSLCQRNFMDMFESEVNADEKL